MWGRNEERYMMGWCPYDGKECRHDGYCDDCAHFDKKRKESGDTNEAKIDKE